MFISRRSVLSQAESTTSPLRILQEYPVGLVVKTRLHILLNTKGFYSKLVGENPGLSQTEAATFSLRVLLEYQVALVLETQLHILLNTKGYYSTFVAEKTDKKVSPLSDKVCLEMNILRISPKGWYLGNLVCQQSFHIFP